MGAEAGRATANLLRAVGRAYPNGAPPAVKVTCDQVWELAARRAILQGSIESLAKKVEHLVHAAGGMRAEIERRIGALDVESSADARKEASTLRAQLVRYDEACETDLRAGRERIATREREASECEAAFREACAALVAHLRSNADCRELLEDEASVPP